MKIQKTDIEGVLVIEPAVFSDERGYFMETYHQKRYLEMGISSVFLQDNLSYSVRGTLRGLHYQYPNAQAKLVQVVRGEIYDVAVDIRPESTTFGKWVGVYLDSDTKRQLFIPEGFAHGFAVISDYALFTYKCSDLYDPSSEKGIIWNDPGLAIDWPVTSPLLSEKDQQYQALRDIPMENLPTKSRTL